MSRNRSRRNGNKKTTGGQQKKGQQQRQFKHFETRFPKDYNEAGENILIFTIDKTLKEIQDHIDSDPTGKSAQWVNDLANPDKLTDSYNFVPLELFPSLECSVLTGLLNLLRESTPADINALVKRLASRYTKDDTYTNAFPQIMYERAGYRDVDIAASAIRTALGGEIPESTASDPIADDTIGVAADSDTKETSNKNIKDNPTKDNPKETEKRSKKEDTAEDKTSNPYDSIEDFLEDKKDNIMTRFVNELGIDGPNSILEDDDTIRDQLWILIKKMVIAELKKQNMNTMDDLTPDIIEDLLGVAEPFIQGKGHTPESKTGVILTKDKSTKNATKLVDTGTPNEHPVTESSTAWYTFIPNTTPFEQFMDETGNKLRGFI